MDDKANNCEYSKRCVFHPDGEGCGLKYHQLWVRTCDEWNKMRKEVSDEDKKREPP